MKTNRRSSWRISFTLVELLLVISVIAILAAMLLPALQKAKFVAQEGSCLNNQRQLSLCYTNYSNDWDGWGPEWGEYRQNTSCVFEHCILAYLPKPETVRINKNTTRRFLQVAICPMTGKTNQKTGYIYQAYDFSLCSFYTSYSHHFGFNYNSKPENWPNKSNLRVPSSMVRQPSFTSF